jgi:hypothetical protein
VCRGDECGAVKRGVQCGDAQAVGGGAAGEFGPGVVFVVGGGEFVVQVGGPEPGGVLAEVDAGQFPGLPMASGLGKK